MLISVDITYKQSSCSLCEIGYRLFRDLNDLIKLNALHLYFFSRRKSSYLYRNRKIFFASSFQTI